MKEKTISYSRVLEILSDAQLKNVLGGSGSGGSGSGGNGSGGNGSGGDGNGTAGTCCYTGEANIEGQWIEYSNCGVTMSYCGYLFNEFEWNYFHCGLCL